MLIWQNLCGITENRRAREDYTRIVELAIAKVPHLIYGDVLLEGGNCHRRKWPIMNGSSKVAVIGGPWDSANVRCLKLKTLTAEYDRC